MRKEDYTGYIKDRVLETPAYVIDLAELERHVCRIREIAGQDIGLCYAMKANPFITRHMDRLVDKVEVCSPGELEICKRMEIPPEDVVFSGVNKTADDIREAVAYGAGVITAESCRHFELVRRYCEDNACTTDVFLRLSDGYQFGMNKDVLERIIAKRAEYPYLHICGIHYFSGTQKKSIDANLSELEMLREYLEHLREKYGFEPEYLEYGAGMYHPYYRNEDFEARYDGFEKLVESIRRLSFPGQVVLEMGRFFAASCGDYLTEVQDLKSVEQKNYCLVDGGIHHLNYFGQNMAMRTPVIEKMDGMEDTDAGSFLKFEEEFAKDCKWTICGSLCTFADILARNVEFEEIHTGDILIFKNAGAYSMTEAPFLFLSRKMPAVYLCGKNRELTKLRDFIASDMFVY